MPYLTRPHMMKTFVITALAGHAAAQGTACLDATDKGIWTSKGKAAFDADMNTCGKKCLGAAKCVTTCVQGAEGYTDACAACFGDLGGCTAKHCWSQCLGGESPKCTACTRTNCVGSPAIPGFANCSGIPPSDIEPAAENVAYGAAAATLINDPLVIKALNADAAASGWVAAPSARFEGVTYAEARSLLGAVFPDSATLAALHAASDTAHLRGLKAPPAAFDARTQWGALIQPIRDQAQCGSCWAFSAAEALSDRFSIATNTSVVLSPEDLVSCDKKNEGCGGGMLPAAWKYLTSDGIVTDKCFPYGAGTGNAPPCATGCADGSPFAASKHKSTGGYALKSVEDMQNEIMANGPIQVAFNVYKSFMTYSTGTYVKKPLELIPEGGHAVKIVGWGTDAAGTDYWTVANSWNTNWGMNGFFNIKRGDNECGIEKRGPPYAGMPAL